MLLLVLFFCIRNFFLEQGSIFSTTNKQTAKREREREPCCLSVCNREKFREKRFAKNVNNNKQFQFKRQKFFSFIEMSQILPPQMIFT